MRAGRQKTPPTPRPNASLGATSLRSGLLVDETELCRWDAPRRGLDDEPTRDGVIVQVRPGAVAFFSSRKQNRPEAARVEHASGRHARRVRAKLPVELPPGQAQRRLKIERPVREPEVQVEAEGRPLYRLKDVQIDRYRVRDDFVKELLAKLDRAVPQRRPGVSRRVPPELGAVCNEGLYDYFMLRLDVDELDRTPKEPAYLILEVRPLAVDAPASILHAEFSHELVQRPAEDQFAALRPYRFGADPGQE